MEFKTSSAASTGQAFLERLRSATHPAHKALEELPVSRSIVQPDLRLDQYAHYLSLMLEVHRDIERNIFPLLNEIIPDLATRKKSPLIEADLSYLQQPFPADAEAPITALIPNPSVAFAMGILYVIEGSTLGGRVILKNIQATLQLNQWSGASYFNGYGDHTGINWKNFLQLLTQFEAERDCSEEIINGAEFAFLAIHRHFEAARK